jgi:hypothetical protein
MVGSSALPSLRAHPGRVAFGAAFFALGNDVAGNPVERIHALAGCGHRDAR